MAKIVIAKSTFKRQHSTRVLARKPTERQHPASKWVVRLHLKTSLQMKPLKLGISLTTVDQKPRRLDFAKATKKLGHSKLEAVLFSDVL